MRCGATGARCNEGSTDQAPVVVQIESQRWPAMPQWEEAAFAVVRRGSCGIGETEKGVG